MRFKKIKEHAIYFLKEVLVVVIGVLIAVTINNYKENSENRSFILKTQKTIKNEVFQNKSQVDEVLERHKEILNSLKSALDNKNETLGDFIERIGGLQAPSIKNIGLRFFISQKADLVDYDFISQLMDIEAFTGILNRKLEKCVDYLYDNIESNERTSKLKFMYYLANVMDSERGLLNLYSSLIDYMG